MLHQGFNVYSDQLAQSAAREWDKVAGRFEEITFRQPLDEIAALVASAIRTRVELIPRVAKNLIMESMKKAFEMGWFGNSVGKEVMQANALPLFPLDPFLLPIASKITHRYGQNERSLFSFIFTYEPFGLREFAAKPLAGEDGYAGDKAADDEGGALQHFRDAARNATGRFHKCQSVCGLRHFSKRACSNPLKSIQ